MISLGYAANPPNIVCAECAIRRFMLLYTVRKASRTDLANNGGCSFFWLELCSSCYASLVYLWSFTFASLVFCFAPA